MTTTVNMKELKVRNIQPHEITKAYNLLQPSGWLHMTQDKLFLLCTCYPQYFYVAVDASNDLIGVLSLYPTFQGQYVMGQVVVQEYCRKQGVGSQMVKTVLNKFPKAGFTLLSDPKAEEFYGRLGFKPAQTLEMCHIELDKTAIAAKSSQLKTAATSFEILKKDSKHELLAYLTKSRTYEDEHHVDVMTQFATCFIAKNKCSGDIVGSICAMEDENGAILIDTLYANSENIADGLFIEAISAFPTATQACFLVNPKKRHLVQFGKLKSSLVLNRFAKGRVNIPKQDKMYAASDPLCRI